MIALHEQDFYAWTQQQAELLKAGQFLKLDVNHLIEVEMAISACVAKSKLVADD